MLLAIARSGRNGLYPNELQKLFGLTRHEIIGRGEELNRLLLVEVLPLTDKNYRLHDDVGAVINPNGTALLETLLE